MYRFNKITYTTVGGIYMKILSYIALTLVIVGSINWGLIGLLDFNLVDALFGTDSFLSSLIYSLVGLAGLYSLYFYCDLSED